MDLSSSQRAKTKSADASAASKPVVVSMTPSPSLTLATLFRQEESPLLRFAVGLVGRRQVAEELVQEAFLRLHKQWDDVENPRGWLYRSLRNLALNYLRDHKRETITEPDDTPDEERLPDETLGRMEAAGMVRLLISEMPPEDGTLIRLKYDEDLKYAEIARRTGLTVGNVGYRLHHLLKGLADSLRHAGIETSEG